MSLILAAALLLSGGGQVDTYLVRAKALQRESPLIDGHNDLPWSIRRSFSDTDLRERRERGQTDIPRLRDGLVGGQFWSVYVPVTLGAEEAVQATKDQIGLVYRLCKKYPDTFEIAWTADDVERIFRSGKIASMMGMEGGHSINNSLETLRDMYKLGARYMTLTHTKNTSWADSATDEPKSNGLNAFGKKVVSEMNRIGMLVDLSHVSAKTMHDALDVAQAPVIFSHSGAYAVCRHTRNVPDDVLKRLRTNGGVCMAVIFPSYVSQAWNDWSAKRQAFRRSAEGSGSEKVREWERVNPEPTANLKQVADHIDHIRKVAGIDHVGIGSDFDGGGGVEGLDDVSKYPHLTAELLRRGYSDSDVKKVFGLNVLRVMRQAEAVSRRLQDKEAP